MCFHHTVRTVFPARIEITSYIVAFKAISKHFLEVLLVQAMILLAVAVFWIMMAVVYMITIVFIGRRIKVDAR
jgi:hypothetical protein